MKYIFHCIVLIVIFLKKYQSGIIRNIYSVHMKLPEVNVTNFTMTSHLSISHIRKICKHRDSICKVNNTRVCALRKINETFQYEDFENSCYLFLSNMCDFPGKEFAIVEGESCSVYLNSSSRRHYETSGVTEDGSDIGATTDTSLIDGNTTKAALRGFSFSTLYEMETAYDLHVCPHSCPAVYQPVCINANRGMGRYLKFYQFVNHCEADKYYCKHWEEFQPPPDRDEESVSASPLGWSYCGAIRYLQFSQLAHTTSSMGHYGWLEGDHRYSKILESHQRKPGYG